MTSLPLVFWNAHNSNFLFNSFLYFSKPFFIFFLSESFLPLILLSFLYSFLDFLPTFSFFSPHWDISNDLPSSSEILFFQL
jgi:hypothetical protein